MDEVNATKGPGRWTDEARQAASARMAARHAKRREEKQRIDPASGGGGSPPGGGSGGGPGVPPGSGSQTGSEPRRGAHLGSNKSNPNPEEPKVTVDTKKIEKGFPAFLRKIFNVLDKIARTLTGYPKAKVSIYFEPYTKEEAELDAELAWPFVEASLPRWAQRHPFLAFLFVMGATFFGKLKIQFRKEIKNGGSTADPAADDEAA